MVYQAITILEITPRGMSIEAACALHNDSLHEFRLVLATRSVVVKGRIERCQVAELGEGNVRYRCSVDFIDPPPHVRDTIDAFVAASQGPPRVVDGEIQDP